MKKDWTIMIYMSGENNLSIDMAYAMQEMRKAVQNTKGLNLFVYFDSVTPSVPTLYCDFSDPAGKYQFHRAAGVKNKLYKKPARSKTAKMQSDSDENSAAMYSIGNFVDWCVNKVEYVQDGQKMRGRKAHRYGLIFSGHSLGFQSVGLLRDETANYSMTLPKLKWMLERLTKNESELEKMEIARFRKMDRTVDKTKPSWKARTSPVLGQPLDILGFDSCVMGMLEVAHAFQDVSKTLIASEGSIPNAGWTYGEILSCLSDSHLTSTEGLAKGIVGEFIAAQDRNSLGGVTVDMAAWNLSAFDKINKPLKDFAESLLACFHPRKSDPATFSQMRRLVSYVHWRCQTYMVEQNIDLSDFCSLIMEELDLVHLENPKVTNRRLDRVYKCSEQLRQAINAIVVIHGFSGGKYQYSNGISLFFPWSLSSYLASAESYEDLWFVRNHEGGRAWRDFLQLFLGFVTLRPSKQIGTTDDETVYYTYEVEGKAGDSSSKTEMKTPINPKLDKSWEPIGRTTINPKVDKGYLFGFEMPGKTTINPKVDKGIVGGETANKTPLNPKLDKGAWWGTDKTPFNPKVDKGIDISTERTPLNPLTDRMPNFSSGRMFGESGNFVQQFMEWKNIQTFWNISGISEIPSYVSELAKTDVFEEVVEPTPEAE